MTPETKDQPTQSPATSSSESDKFNTSVTTKNVTDNSPWTDDDTRSSTLGPDTSCGFMTPMLVNPEIQSTADITVPPLPPFPGDSPPFLQYGVDWFDDSYPAWTGDPNCPLPLSIDQIATIFVELRDIFGFQHDSVRNMFDHLMTLLDSRASRMGPNMALLTIHADFFGGDNANFRKWYFASQLFYREILSTHPDRPGEKSSWSGVSLPAADATWKALMNKLSSQEMVTHVILYLLCWGEANQVRFMPECLSFIFKCANDYYDSVRATRNLAPTKPCPEGHYMDTVITPLYRYCRNQVYHQVNGSYVPQEKDHKDIIGYDDMNQLFWHYKGLERLVTSEGTKVIELSPEGRYHHLKDIQWDNVFYKTYWEKRTWLHLLVNFNRIWIIHISIFWFYTSFNVPALYTVNYDYTENNEPPSHVRWTIVAVGGAFAPLINLLATFSEYFFVPRRYPGAPHLIGKLFFYVFLLGIIVSPTVYILRSTSLEEPDYYAHVIAIVQLTVSIILVLILSIVPLQSMFNFHLSKSKRRMAEKFFVASFHKLRGNDLLISYGLWICVFVAKLTESYFFLTLSLRDPVRELAAMSNPRCTLIFYLGNWLCRQQTRIVLSAMILTDLILFLLDTYLWYIIFNTLFSVARSFYLGISIWSPWRSIYARLPKRIQSKILYTRYAQRNSKLKSLVSHVWNAVVVSMYREHLLPLEQVQKLIFQQETSVETGERVLHDPPFFVCQEDQSFRTTLFERQGEAERRISFFAQSLSTPIPEPMPVEQMPTFTVLIPHYNERIVLSLREIIREEDEHTKVTLLEYLKQLYPQEWNCFVKDTMGLAKDPDIYKLAKDPNDPGETNYQIPYYCIGFKSSSPEFILRTRLWASLRTQTLYRTISGFMNYSRAIKLLYSVETLDLNPQVPKGAKFEKELRNMAKRKFKLLATLQRLAKFGSDEIRDKEMMLRAYPEIRLAYLEEEPGLNQGDEPIVYSALIDGECEILANGQRKPKYRIRLSGDPLLGDGKSDNQNHAIIFHRGEYIQLVDANQDNYLEECLKIRSVLAEFEEMEPPTHPYIQQESNHQSKLKDPVAILGAREYVFSENIGVLGDVAAGKEQTFGTLFARTLSKIGSKLHYGHPDFLNATFMTTRGGVSKAQKGLHLNEDIYAGMNALMRGGRIKHCEFNQCGKGRDLGFGSILNFTTKIGAGMGEQMLSREYYYLGTRLPLDRFLSFFYAHPGFHINNMLIIVSLELILVVSLNLAALARGAIICTYEKDKPITDVRTPPGCQNLIPVFEWIQRCVLSIFVVFFISFLPLFVQELTERGFWRSVTRLGKHFGSLSPLFEVFVCQIYAQSLMHDLSLGGAKYIATGRGFATTRISFTVLYGRFGVESLYFGFRLLLILIFITMTMWNASLLWFWVTTVALCLAPVIYNPHQFSFMEFFLDYRQFIHWLSRGNTRWHKNSWIGYTRMNRSRLTGYKVVGSGKDDRYMTKDVKKPSFLNLIWAELVGSLLIAGEVVIPYLYISASQSMKAGQKSNPILRLGIISAFPIVLNTVSLIASLSFSFGCCCVLSRKWTSTPSFLASFVHFISLVNYGAAFELILLMERWSYPNALLALLSSIMVQAFIFKCITILFISRELRTDEPNLAWWSGRWVSTKLGWMTFSQIPREFICKIMEMSMFSMDFTLGHLILFVQAPLVFIPYIDQWHSMMLFWLNPKRRIAPPVFTRRQKRTRHRLVQKYVVLFFITMVVFLALIIAPAILPNFKTKLADLIDDLYPGIVQPPLRKVTLPNGQKNKI